MLASLGEKPRARASGDLPDSADGANHSVTRSRGVFAKLRHAMYLAITWLATLVTRLVGGLVHLVARLAHAIFRPLVVGFNWGYDQLADRYPAFFASLPESKRTDSGCCSGTFFCWPWR